MTTSKPQKVRIALFAISAGFLLASVILAFAGLYFWKDRTTYHIVFDRSVHGLEKGADVFYNGVRVGNVEEIALDPIDMRFVRVDIEVDSSLRIPADTKAALRFAGITGLKVIDLRDGTFTAPRLAAGARIEPGVSALEDLELRGKKIMDETTEMLERANAIIAQSEILAKNLTALTDPSQLGALVEQTRVTAAHLAAASRSLGGLVEDNRAGIKASVAAIEVAAKRTAELVDNGQLRAAIADLKHASRSFKDLARDLRHKPSRLFFSNAVPERKLP